MVQDSKVVTTKPYQELVCILSNSAILSDLEYPKPPYFSQFCIILHILVVGRDRLHIW